jgi:hypothetical protein
VQTDERVGVYGARRMWTAASVSTGGNARAVSCELLGALDMAAVTRAVSGHGGSTTGAAVENTAAAVGQLRAAVALPAGGSGVPTVAVITCVGAASRVVVLGVREAGGAPPQVLAAGFTHDMALEVC